MVSTLSGTLRNCAGEHMMAVSDEYLKETRQWYTLKIGQRVIRNFFFDSRSYTPILGTVRATGESATNKYYLVDWDDGTEEWHFLGTIHPEIENDE